MTGFADNDGERGAAREGASVSDNEGGAFRPPPGEPDTGQPPGPPHTGHTGHTGPAPKPPARQTMVVILTVLVVLLVGIIIGILIGQNNNDGPADGAATGAATPGATQPATSSPTAEPTLTEEERQEILDLIRAQPRRDPEDPLARGAVDAPVVLIEYADYRCSYCARFTLETKPGLAALVEDGTLRMEWRDFPVFQNESIDLAVAARAAGNQGLFWEYNEAIFAYQFVDGNQDFTATALTALAERVGVPDLERFTADLGSAELRAAVQAEYEASLALLGQASTPQFLVNDQYIGGAQPLEYFQTVIEQELAKVQG